MADPPQGYDLVPMQRPPQAPPQIDGYDLVPIPLHRLPPELQGDIDRRTGAPGAWRAQVGSHDRPDQRLNALRRLAPDAQPHGDDNFLFTHPQTGRRTLYNPPGLDWGDLPSLAPEVGELVGGGLGAMGGAALAAPTGPGAIAAGAAGAGIGAAAGREAAQQAVQSIYGTPDTRSVGQHVQDAGETALINAAGQGVGGMALAAGRRLFGPVARRLTGWRTGQEALDDFAVTGVRPDVASITGNPTATAAQRGFSTLPGGATQGKNLVEGQADEMARAMRGVTQEHADLAGQAAGVPASVAVVPPRVPSPRLAARITDQEAARAGSPRSVAVRDVTGPPTAEEAGAVVREGSERAAQRMRSRVGRLEDAAYDLVGRNTPVADLPAVSALRRRLEREASSAPASLARDYHSALEKIGALEQDLADGLGFEALRRVRTSLGKSLADTHNPAAPVGPTSRTSLDALYGALTEDMHAVARSVSPEASRALERAIRYNRFNSTQNMPGLERVLEKKTDEHVFQMLFPNAGRPNAQAVNRVLRNLEPQERHAVASAVLERLGRTVPSARNAGHEFSIDTLMTNWAKLTENPTARAAILRDAKQPELGQALDRLLRVGQRIKAAGTERNWSNTAASQVSADAALGALGAVGAWATGHDTMHGAMAGILLPIVGSHAMMKYAFTNPAFVNWLASNAPAAARQGLTQSMVSSLGRVAGTNPMLRAIWDNYRDQFETQFNPSPGGRRAAAPSRP